MFSSPSNVAARCTQEKNIAGDFSRLPEEIQNKIIGHVNPVITKIFSQYIDSKPAVTGQRHKDIVFFASRHNFTHKRLYFKDLELNDVVAIAEQVCAFIKEKDGITITPFEYFEVASGRRALFSIDVLIQSELEKALHNNSLQDRQPVGTRRIQAEITPAPFLYRFISGKVQNAVPSQAARRLFELAKSRGLPMIELLLTQKALHSEQDKERAQRLEALPRNYFLKEKMVTGNTK